MPPASSRDDFLITGANRGALAMLDAPERWPQGRLLLIGGPGSGKSHLAGFWADEHGAQIVQGWTLSPAHIDDLIPQGGAVVVEDGHEIGANPAAEQGLFHLWNLTGARQGLLLITAQTPPRDWDIRLPDLRSRLDTAAQSVLPPPDEALLPAVLVKLFADRHTRRKRRKETFFHSRKRAPASSKCPVANVPALPLAEGPHILKVVGPCGVFCAQASPHTSRGTRSIHA